MPTFTATFSAVAVTAAQDVFEIVADATTRVRILGIKIGQYTDFGDAAAEILSVQVIRGYTTSGGAGAAVTPANIRGYSGAAAAASVVERNNTTLATAGTAVVLLADVFNIAIGWSLLDVIDRDHIIEMAAGERLVVRITAPADSITMNGTLIFEEIGVSPIA